ncbi:hypothetical protein BGZ99_005299 [Dissophora globulifera]|uniref:DnaJ-domain-containing protein n=1 Tax=Dissophora globulifera TaxID=979702 RepID=A0A9P6UZR3_9FUNG|nr:hypothetical protein BGZ99_005299 [Dissophora globulifera]
MRTCHYVILGLEKNASDSDIKKAYRRKALEWHPDKNHHRVEEATKQFAFIAEAYEVLSDPQERAWYDSHRDAILRGDDLSDQSESSAGTTAADLMKYFSTSVYKGFQDNSAGFYAVYRNLFEKLAQEEAEAVDNDRSDDTTGAKVHYASFGSSTTPYDNNSDSDVKQFYNAWLTFTSQKSFSWCDKYRLSEAPDRRVRRAMEKENKKFRDAARKEFNDTVLSLASYVRKRDPRFLAIQQQQKLKQQQVQADLKARMEREKEALRAKAGQFQEQAWTRVQDEDENESGSDNNSDDEFDQEFECIICDKFFKSERQWKNHERSKRHLKAVEDIRLEMLHEENQLKGLSASTELDGDDSDHGEEEEEEEVEMPSRQTKSAAAADADYVHEDILSGSDLDGELEEPSVVTTPLYSDLKSKKKNKKKKVMTTNLDIDEDEIDEMDQDGLADLLGSVRMSSTSSPLARSRASTPSARRSRAQKGQWSEGSENENEADGTPFSTAPGSRAESPDGTKTKKLSGKDKKKARSERAAQKLADAGSSLKCRVCSVEFTSKNQLFAHTKETGHAVAAASASNNPSTAGSPMMNSGFSSDEEQQTRGKGKKGRGKRK